MTLKQNHSNCSALMNKLATRAINRKKLETTSPVKPVDRHGRVGQSVGHLTHKSKVLSSVPGLATNLFLLPQIQEGQL